MTTDIFHVKAKSFSGGGKIMEQFFGYRKHG